MAEKRFPLHSPRVPWTCWSQYWCNACLASSFQSSWFRWFVQELLFQQDTKCVEQMAKQLRDRDHRQSCGEYKTSLTPTLCSSRLEDSYNIPMNFLRWCCRTKKSHVSKTSASFIFLPENAICYIWQRAISIINEVFERTLSCFQHTHASDSADNRWKIFYPNKYATTFQKHIYGIFYQHISPPRSNVAVEKRVQTGVWMKAWLCNFWFAFSRYATRFHIICSTSTTAFVTWP